MNYDNYATTDRHTHFLRQTCRSVEEMNFCTFMGLIAGLKNDPGLILLPENAHPDLDSTNLSSLSSFGLN